MNKYFRPANRDWASGWRNAIESRRTFVPGSIVQR
jgi:hypothetical protein